MQCENFEQRLHWLLDRRRLPQHDPQLSAHAALCPGCQSRLASYEALWDGLVFSEAPSLDADFANRVLDCLTEEKRTAPPKAKVSLPDRGRTGVHHLAWTAAALSILVVATIWQWAAAPGNNPGLKESSQAMDAGSSLSPFWEAEVSVDAKTVACPEPIPSNGEPLLATIPALARDEALVDASLSANTSDDLAQRPLDDQYLEVLEILKQVALPWPATELSLAEEHDQEVPPTSQRLEWVEEVAVGLRPLASSAAGAWNVLRKSIPAAKEPPLPEKPQAAWPIEDGISTVA